MMRVIDNFFKDPYAIRKLALKQTYKPDPDFKWPGMRMDFYKNPALDSYRIKYADCYKKFLDVPCEAGWMYFQSIDKSWGQGICHADYSVRYTIITYLNIDSPPDSGTEVYGETFEAFHDFLHKSADIKKSFFKKEKNLIDTYLYNKKLKKFNSKFTDPCIVPNKFNRTLIFEGKRVHRAQNFFGTTLADSRLTLISFFK